MGFKARPVGYDDDLAMRVRVALGPIGVTERKMLTGSLRDR